MHRSDDIVGLFMRRTGRRHKVDMFEAANLANLLGTPQVAEVDGIKRSAKDPDAHMLMQIVTQVLM